MSEDYSKHPQFTATGQLDVSQQTIMVQEDAIYSLGHSMITLATLGATAGRTAASEFYCTSGTTQGAVASVYTKYSIPFCGGQSMGMTIDCRFGTPQAEVNQIVGFNNSSDSLSFGYQGTSFGIFYIHHGQQEIWDLFVTARSTASSLATVTIGGVEFTFTLNIGATIADTARDIAIGINSQTSLWVAQAIGTKVIVRSLLVNNYTDSFSFSHATATANFVKVVDGSTQSRSFYELDSWNSLWDESSGRSIKDWFNPLKGNVYKIVYNWGYGNINFSIFDPISQRFNVVHTIRIANRAAIPFVGNPNFRIAYSTVNKGTPSTPVSLYGSCLLGYVDGKVELLERSHSVSNTNLSVSTTDVAVLTVSCRQVFGSRVNANHALLSDMTATSTSTKNTTISLYLNPTFTGSQTYNYVDEEQSLVIYDTKATTISGGILLDSFVIGSNSTIQRSFANLNIRLAPGDIIVAVAKVSSGAASEVTVSTTWLEYH